MFEVLSCHRNLNRMTCALVHASATPIIGVVPACLAALISLVRLLVASIFCVLTAMFLPILTACISSSPDSFSDFQHFQQSSRFEAHIGSVLLVRSFLSIVSMGMYGFAFERISGSCYGGVTGTEHIAAPFEVFSH